MADAALPSIGMPRARSRLWGRIRRSPTAIAGGIVVLLFIVVAVAAPWLATHDPVKTDWLAVRKPPTLAHWMGTDEIGRDLYSRMVFGTQASLLAGVISVVFAVSLGVPLGEAGAVLQWDVATQMPPGGATAIVSHLMRAPQVSRHTMACVCARAPHRRTRGTVAGGRPRHAAAPPPIPP